MNTKLNNMLAAYLASLENRTMEAYWSRQELTGPAHPATGAPVEGALLGG